MDDSIADYLWDKSGSPDPEIQHLELLLSVFRYRPQSFKWPSA